MNLIDMAKEVLSGTSATMLLFFSTIIISIPLGLIVAIGRMSNLKILSNIIRIIISILRGTPLMLQLIIWNFAPYYVFGISISPSWRLIAVILGFSINYAAYFAEIFRGGIQSVPNGQREAASMLGYSKNQTFFKIILPQMWKKVLPAVTNEIITLVKDTSLAFAITYIEVFTLAKQVAAANTTIIPLFIAGAFYYVFNFIVDVVMNKIENSMAYFD